MQEFFNTVMGRRFYEGYVPQIANALLDIAKELKRANDLEEEARKPHIEENPDPNLNAPAFTTVREGP